MNCERIDTPIGTIYFSAQKKADGLSKREKQREQIDGLFAFAGYTRKDISYEPSGQPYINVECPPFISISHSDQFGVIYMATQPVGVDIQTFHTKIVAGKDYFINEREQQFKTTQELHIVWAAKEVMYKLFAGNFKDARNQITVLSIDMKEKTVSIELHQQLKRIQFQLNDTYVLAYSLD